MTIARTVAKACIFAFLGIWLAGIAAATQPAIHFPDSDPPTGLTDSAALRATVYGTPPQNLAPVPQTVPLQEINISLPWKLPVPEVFWFNRRLRAWFAEQDKPAPLAILISGTGADGNTAKIAMLRSEEHTSELQSP